MPVRPTLPERLALYRLNWGPAPIVDRFAAAGFRAVTLAIDLGVFEALAAGHESPGAVAETADGYAPSSMTRRWLLGDDPNMAPWLTYWQEIVFPFWDEYLEASVREGEPPVNAYEYVDERGGWEQTQRGFRAVATLLADDVFDAIDLTAGDATLLDVGGGHGYDTLEACRRQPDLRATILDAPTALGLAREEVAAAGLEERIELQGGDALADDLGDGYDLAVCSNVAHGFEPAENRALFERIHDALAPGGRLVVLDQFAGSSRLAIPTLGHTFTAFVYNKALGATVYEAAEMEGWLRTAGFESVDSTRFRTVPGTGLLEASKPDR